MVDDREGAEWNTDALGPTKRGLAMALTLKLRERYGAKSEKSLMMRFHSQTAGVTLTAQQPDVNVVRVAIQALAAEFDEGSLLMGQINPTTGAITGTPTTPGTNYVTIKHTATRTFVRNGALVTETLVGGCLKRRRLPFGDVLSGFLEHDAHAVAAQGASLRLRQF